MCIRDRRQGFAAWVLLFYALWHAHHVPNIRDCADVRDALETGRRAA